VIGVALIPIAGQWIFGGEMGGAVKRYTFATWAAPFYNAVYILLVLSLLNLPLRRRFPRIALNHLELLAIYIMVSVASAMISSDLQGVLVTLMGYPAYFADSSNDWARMFSGALPTWLMVNDRTALIGFYQGDSSFFRPEHLSAWIRPVIAWTVFLWALLLMMLCVNTILRKAWIERERLTFPIIALPMAMTEQRDCRRDHSGQRACLHLSESPRHTHQAAGLPACRFRAIDGCWERQSGVLLLRDNAWIPYAGGPGIFALHVLHPVQS
jgi:hypothetical protein